MKKLTLFLVAILAMVNVANAQRAWAYDLELTPSVDSYTFAFKAVTAGDATLVFYKEGVEAGTLDLGAVSAGDNTITKTSEELLDAIQQSGDFTWGVKMTGSAIAAGSTLKEVTDQTRGIYDFYNMMDVLVDNNPESDYFGKIYIQMALNGGSDGATPRSKAQKAGLFIYDQELNELNPTSNVGIMPTLPSGYTLGSGGRDKFHRLEIDPKTGNLVYCYNIANYPAVFSINRANPTGLVTNLIDGISGFTRTCAHCFDAEGTLYVMDLASNKGTIYKIKDGVKTQWTTTDDKFVNASMTMSSDGMGGLWVAQNRGQLDSGDKRYYQLVHVTKDGTFDWVVNYDTPHGFTGSSVRGALAYDAERKILAQGRNGKVELFSVVYDAGTGVPTLTKFAVTPSVGNNIDGLHFDYAGDLYVVNSSNEKFQKFVVPTNNNTCTVPAKKSQVIKLESITLNAHPVKDYSASIVGTMKRAIQNGENTIVLTHEANGTAHIYNIAHTTKTITEISQEGVVAVDPDNAGDLLAISDIALTDDGKLVACNYIVCQFDNNKVDPGYKRGTSHIYIWNDLAGNPEEWLTSQKTGNYNVAYMGHTMALKGTSMNAEVTISAFNKTNTNARYSHLYVVDGTYSDANYKYSRDNAALHPNTLGPNTYELNASPLAAGKWIVDGEFASPIEFVEKNGVAIDTYTALSSNVLGKKYNGASYLFHNDHHLMVAPYADGDGKLAGVKVLAITNGFAAAIQITTSTDLTSAISATAAAATAYVDGDGDLTIYLFADSKVYAFSEKEYTAATYTVTATANEGGSVEGGGTYDEGATATLTATPAEHYEFTGWTGDVTSTDNPLTITVDGNKTITANFTKKQYTLTVFVNDENKGTIDVATGSHEYGTEVTLTATPKPNYKLLAWSNKATTESITVTMDNNKAVSAYFVKEYANEPTFTIEKVWENTNVPGATANGFQGVGWDQKIYIKDRGNNQILSLDATESSIYATLETSSDDQPIAVDEAGNLIVRSGSTLFYNAPTQVRIFRKGETTSKVIDFTLPATGRCDFITASGNIFSEKGGYVYFFCASQTTVSRLFIKNGEYAGVDTVGTIDKAAASQSNVVLDIYGNIHTQSKNAGAYEYNITTLASTADLYLGAVNKQTPNSTIGGCTFELGGKEFWAYVAGTTNYSSEWQLINATDGKLVSEEILFAKDKTSHNSAANWLNVQVVDEKTAYIYQFCPTVAAAVWKVSFKENYTVSATANPVAGGTVTGADTYQEGATATLTATPNTGYKFVNWTTGGVEVSTEATYSFPVTENVELVANFEAITSKDPRAWAYDMKLGEEGDNYTFTFKATTAGQATITFKDKDGNALAQPESQTMPAVAGENKFTIAKNAFAAGVDAFWSITMDGAPIEGVVEVTDQSRGIYDFYNMMGVVVDNNTDSKDFGRIYVQASLNGKSGGITDRAKAQKAGIFIYNQDLDELNSPSNVGYKPTLPNGYEEIGSSSSTFQRLNIHPKTGNLVFSHAVSDQPAVFAINREDMTGAVTNLLTGVADMTRSVAHCFDAEGMLYVMDFADEEGTVYKVINGEATPFTKTSDKFINAYITIVSDGRGGLWISQNRGQFDAEPYLAFYQLAHVTSTGEFDWVVNRDTPHGLEGSSSRGALAYDVERKILAQGRNGKVELYSVSYEPTITLTPLHTIASNDLGTNIDGLAFDYAGDLYVVNSYKEKFQKFTLPTADNICTVAAPSSEAIRFTPVYTVSVESNNNEWGIVSGGGTFEEGQSTTITATAATNYKFINWTKGGTEVSTENPYTFSVTETATYTANFVEKTKYTIDVIIVEDAKMGTVTGVGSYYEGTEVTLTAKANGGYVFVKWSDEVTDESRTVTASEDVTLQAIFKVATPRTWAYDLKKGEDSDNYTFTFTATSDGNATILFTDKDGNAVAPTQEVVGAVTAGETKTVSIAKTQFTGDKDIYWSVKVAGDPITKMAELTDPTKGIYSFYLPQGVAVDNNTDSEYFGRIYLAEANDGGNDGQSDRTKAQKRGIFMFDQKLADLNPTANVGVLPANAATAMTNKTRQAIHRVAVNPTNGQVAFAYNIEGATAIWSMNPNDMTANASNLINGADDITKASSLCFDEDGALYVMNNANTGTIGGQIYKVENGVATLFAAHQAGKQWAVDDNAMAADGRGGLWIAQNRYAYTPYPILTHVNKDGTVDFAVTENLNDWFPNNTTGGASYRGQCAYNAKEDILAFAGNRVVALFKVEYDSNGKPTLTEKLMTTVDLNPDAKDNFYIDGVAFDYAGDLYVASASTERLYKFVIPTTDNTCTVPAPKSQVIQKETRYTVTVKANPAEGGTVTVSDGGNAVEGATLEVTATANTGYRFVNWTKDAEEVSTSASFEYTVPAEDVTLTANFAPLPEITYELNGGVWNKYGWTSKKDMYNALLDDWRAYSGSARTNVTYETQLGIGNSSKGIPTTIYYTEDRLALQALFTDATYAPKWGWLATYVDAVAVAQSKATQPTTSAGHLVYALGNFFGEDNVNSTNWMGAVDFTGEEAHLTAFAPYWGQTFPLPTQPTEEVILNAPYKEGYLFEGWYAASDFSGAEVTTVDETTNGTLYAKWLEHRYTRTVTNGNFGTICLPYGSSSYSGAEFYEIAYLELQADGVTPKGIWLDEVTGALEAGKPYIFKATSTLLTVNYKGEEALSPKEGVAGLTGTFSLIEDLNTSDPSNTLEGNYMINENKFWLCGTGCWLNANRAYIEHDALHATTTPVSPIPGRRRVMMGAAGENTTTGVNNLTEGGAIAPNVEGTYDVLGRKFTEPNGTGFYIVNGKKVVIVK